MQNYFFIRTERRWQKINFQDIFYVKARKNYITVVTEKKSYMILVSLRELEKMLPCKQFCRVHRSYIVSLDHADGFDHENVYLKQMMIPVGEQYRAKMKSSVQVLVCESRTPIKLSNYTTESLLKE